MLEEKTVGLSTSIAVIQNWAELETVHPEPRADNELLKELGLEDKFVFLYAGNMGHPNDLETIVRTAKLLANEEQFHFIFLGSGVKESYLRNEAAISDLTNITILPPKPRAEQVVFINACDIALVSLVPKMWGVSMPSRTYNILAAGKPILALTEPNSELAIVIDEDKVGWHLPPGDADAMASCIRRIYQERDDLSALGMRARKAALDKYSLAAALEKYRRALGFVE